MSGKWKWHWLYSLETVSAAKIKKLLDIFGSVDSIWLAEEKALAEAGVLTEVQVRNILLNRQEETAREKYNMLLEEGIRMLIKQDKDFPDPLQHIYNSPNVLYFRGSVPDNVHRRIAIVGARMCSYYGREMAELFAKQLAEAGCCVVSGMARGVDSFAHRGVLSAGGKTIAVLGSGLHVCYPPENASLMEQIEQSGCVLSELPPDAPPLKEHFPMRNRLISGLSDGILVVEAKKRSGALITANMGLEQGKDIFAIPGRVGDTLSVGTNDLIKMGAKAVTCVEDILEEYGMPQVQNTNKEKGYGMKLSPNERKVYDCLEAAPVHVDEVILKSGLEVKEVLRILTKLEMENLVVLTGGNYLQSKSIKNMV